VHWGDELFAYPAPNEREIATALSQAGVDTIIVHHPHVVRGMETIGAYQVFYSLGNLFFSDIPDNQGWWINRKAPRNREGLGI
jgi:poly-gamma-glutamate capsule biosynthesis protein CapA/YwtB (metallophosphatase superfamily)